MDRVHRHGDSAGMSSRRRRGHARAFTLFELLVTASIMAIAAAMVVPMMGANDTNQLRAAAGLLAADIGYAQSHAITHTDAPCVVVFHASLPQFQLATAATPETPLTHPVDKQSYVTRFGQGRAAHLAGVAIASVSLDGDRTLGFGAFGELDQATDATITLSSGGKQITVTVDADTGEATIGSVTTTP